MPVSRNRRRAGAASLAALAALSIADAARGATFTVDRTTTGGDITIDGICDADASIDVDCSLAAAVEEANATAATDTIAFKKGSVAGGDADDESFGPSGSAMQISAPPPSITAPLVVDAGNCQTAAGQPAKPCATVASGWEIDSTGEVRIQGLAFNGVGSTIGVRVINIDGTVPSIPDFILFGSWFGIDRNGADGPNNLGPAAVQLEDVEGARIGSGFPDDRNLFARHEVGIDILGADDTEIFGNWFGVDPDGTFSRDGEFTRANGDSIEVTSDAAPNPDDEAVGTIVGAADAGPGATPECDGGCNVLAGAGVANEGSGVPNADAVDLVGEGGDEVPASDVLIVGNDIGVSVVGNARAVDVGDADGVAIGGPGEGDGNLIDRGEVSSGTGASALLIQGNRIDRPDSGSTTPALDLRGSGEVRDNSIAAVSDSPAINLANTTTPGFAIQGNVIGETPGGATAAGQVGIDVDSGADGNLIGGVSPDDGNLIAGVPPVVPSAPVGIRIAGDDNVVVGNELGRGSDGSARRLGRGIVLETDADDNVIGSEEAAGANEITNVTGPPTGGDAIAVLGANSDGNRILSNRGDANAGLFIDLGGDGAGNLLEPDGPNGGAQAPLITSASTTAAVGTAAPGSEVRVFAKAGPDPGELGVLLAQTTATGSGSWAATVPAQAAGDLLAATATTAEGTSELSSPIAVAAPPSPPAAPDADPPETTIGKRPKDVIKVKGKKRARAKYLFAADEAGSTFTCAVDRKPTRPCTSPLRLSRLKKGRHRVSIVATDPAGNVDATAATDSFKVKRKRKR
jgi:hypothetical protein